MLITFALVVIVAAIVVFFSDEFARLFKKIAAIPGVKLFVPLIFASWVVERFDTWLVWMLLKLKQWMHGLIYALARWLPIEKGALSTAHVLNLFLVTVLPLLILHFSALRKPRYELWPYTYHLVITIWLVLVILLTIHHPG